MFMDDREDENVKMLEFEFINFTMDPRLVAWLYFFLSIPSIIILPISIDSII